MKKSIFLILDDNDNFVSYFLIFTVHGGNAVKIGTVEDSYGKRFSLGFESDCSDSMIWQLIKEKVFKSKRLFLKNYIAY